MNPTDRGTSMSLKDLVTPTMRSPRDISMHTFFPKSPTKKTNATADKDKIMFVSIREDNYRHSPVVFHAAYDSRRGDDPENCGGKQRRNQDALIIQTSIIESKDVYFFAVIDGHGPLGHKAARLVCRGLVERVKKNLKRGRENPREMLIRCFEEVEQYLETNAPEVIESSGTTCIAALQIEHKLYVANIGDSRCFIGRHRNELGETNSGFYDLISLSRDHVPSIEEERDRILRDGGVIDTVAAGVEGYITRVRNPEAARRCALAMTRSFGDISFKHVGVCAVPEIQEVELDYRHAYILLCSDGVTGALSDRRVSEIINDNRMGTSQQVTDAIIEEARACWDCGEFDMDDITVIFSWLLVDKKMDDFRESDIFGPSLSTIMRSLGTKKLSSSQWPPKAAYSTSVPIPMVNDHVGNDQMAIPKGNLIRMRSTPMTREKDADDITRQLSRELRLENKLGRSRGVLKRYR